MPEPLALPIRILVKGASTVSWTSGVGGPRTDFIFPRALEAELLQAGRPAQVQTISVPSERVKSTLQHWEREFLGWSPDVVVLLYGHYETIHLFLPWWLERHANSLKGRPGQVRELYRRRALRPVWMFLARLQARLDAKLDPNLRRGRPRRAAADLERLIGHVQEVASPLVILVELLPPAKRYRSWFPGMAARIPVMNQAIAEMVDKLGLPNVRILSTSAIVSEHFDGDVDRATPDGFHYTPEMHRLVGAALARDVIEWADTQEHLKQGTARPSAARRRAARD